ncbi:hypothetical protein QQ045_000468 [Rhodiola kirilowii]
MVWFAYTAAQAGCFRTVFRRQWLVSLLWVMRVASVHDIGVQVEVEALRVVVASDCCGGGVVSLVGCGCCQFWVFRLLVVRAGRLIGRWCGWGVHVSDGESRLNDVDSGRAGGRMICWALLWGVVATAVAPF